MSEPSTIVTALYLDGPTAEWVPNVPPAELPDRPVWWIVTHWAEVDGRMECVGFDLRSLPPEGEGYGMASNARPVTASLARKLPVDAIKREARDRLQGRSALMVSLAAQPNWRVPDVLLTEASAALEVFASETKGRYLPEHFLDVATVYADAWEHGENPARAVRDRWKVPASTAGKWVSIARNKYQYLEPTEKRVPNGRLTAKARAELEARG